MCFDSALFFIFGSVLFCSGFFFLLLLLLLFNNPVSNCIHRFYTSILNETKERGIYFECISAGCWMFAAVSSMNLGSLDRHFSNIVYRYELLSWALTCLLFQIPASGICSSDGNSVVVFLFSLVPSKSHFQMGTFGADFHEMVKKTEQKKQKKTIQWIEHQLELVLSSLWLWKWICLVAGTRWSGAGALRLLTFKRRNVANVSLLFSASDSEKKQKKTSRLIKDEVQVTLVVVSSLAVEFYGVASWFK